MFGHSTCCFAQKILYVCTWTYLYHYVGPCDVGTKQFTDRSPDDFTHISQQLATW